MKNKIYLAMILTGIHFLITISCIFISYAVAASRFDSPNSQEGLIELLTSKVSAVLIQPMYGIQELLQIDYFGIIGDCFLLLNSILWGLMMTFVAWKINTWINSKKI